MFFGGFTRHIFSIISFCISIIFVFENIMFVILSFYVILFAVFSVICYYDIDKKGTDDLIQAKLFLQMILNIIIFSICMRILIDSIQLMHMLNKLRKEISNLSEGTPSGNQNNYEGFKFNDFNGNQHILKELMIDNFPRNIFYKENEEIGGPVNKIEYPESVVQNESMSNDNNKNNSNNKSINDDNNIHIKNIYDEIKTINKRRNDRKRNSIRSSGYEGESLNIRSKRKLKTNKI